MMKVLLKSILKRSTLVIILFDILLSPFMALSILWLRVIKSLGLKKSITTKKILKSLKVHPIVDHYYEPAIDFSNYKQKYRYLEPVDFNNDSQINLIRSFAYQNELLEKPLKKSNSTSFYYNNGTFSHGDDECYYSMIRKFKPKRIVEIGSGFSTLIAAEAKYENMKENPNDLTIITCIEPYEASWLSQLNVYLIRKKVEDVDINIFEQLNENDILFIDSTHVIKPEGDVLFEVLQILPKLKSGVLIHFHDIYTPLNYPESWLRSEYRLWNEQYLLEAFLSYNKAFEVIIAMSYMSYNHRSVLCEVFPVFAHFKKSTPSSFWIRKK